MYLAYQVHSNSWSSFNTVLKHSTPFPISELGFDPRIDIPPSPYHHHTIALSIGQLPLGTVSWPIAPGYDRHSLMGEEEKDSSRYLV